MKISVMVGQLEDGSLEYMGQPGEFAPLDAKRREIVDAGGVVGTGKKAKKYQKITVGHVAGRTKNCK